MADHLSLQITGLAEFRKTLDQLPQSITSRVLKGMVATGASVLRKEAILRAPIYTGPESAGHPPPGTLKKAIYQFRLARECGRMRETFIVSVRRGKFIGKARRLNKTDAYYASWVEYGTAKTPAHPFMRPAFESKKEAAIAAMREYLIDRLPDALRGAQIAAGAKP